MDASFSHFANKRFAALPNTYIPGNEPWNEELLVALVFILQKNHK